MGEWFRQGDGTNRVLCCKHHPDVWQERKKLKHTFVTDPSKNGKGKPGSRS